MDTQDQILLKLGTLEGKMDALLLSRDAQHSRLNWLEASVNKLERKQAWLYGAMVASGALGAGVTKALSSVGGL
jgi:hypothetical protein